MDEEMPRALLAEDMGQTQENMGKTCYYSLIHGDSSGEA